MLKYSRYLSQTTVADLKRQMGITS